MGLCFSHLDPGLRLSNQSCCPGGFRNAMGYNAPVKPAVITSQKRRAPFFGHWGERPCLCSAPVRGPTQGYIGKLKKNLLSRHTASASGTTLRQSKPGLRLWLVTQALRKWTTYVFRTPSRGLQRSAVLAS